MKYDGEIFTEKQFAFLVSTCSIIGDQTAKKHSTAQTAQHNTETIKLELPFQSNIINYSSLV